MIKNVCFEGGGIKGIAYGGALESMEELNLLKGIKRVAGTSAGAITAVLFSLGYNPKELSSIISNTNFNDFKDDDLGILRDSYRLYSEYGWHKGDKFREWIGGLIKDKVGKENLCFKELKNYSNIELYLCATNLSKQRVEIFSHINSPNLEIRDAARMSMSIPFYFKAVEYNNDIIVDGGVSYNYPIDIFDKECSLDETIGLKLDSKDEIKNYQNGNNVPKDIDGIDDFIISLLSFMMVNDEYLKEKNLKRTIFIDTADVGTVDFDISSENKIILVNNGKKAVQEYFMK